MKKNQKTGNGSGKAYMSQGLLDSAKGNTTSLEAYEMADIGQEAAKIASLTIMNLEIPDFSDNEIKENLEKVKESFYMAYHYKSRWCI